MVDVIVLPLLFSPGCLVFYYYRVSDNALYCRVGAILYIFQPAHIMETSGFEVPWRAEGKSRWKIHVAIHEIANTTNFAPRNRFLTWFAGGSISR